MSHYFKPEHHILENSAVFCSLPCWWWLPYLRGGASWDDSCPDLSSCKTLIGKQDRKAVLIFCCFPGQSHWAQHETILPVKKHSLPWENPGGNKIQKSVPFLFKAFLYPLVVPSPPFCLCHSHPHRWLSDNAQLAHTFWLSPWHLWLCSDPQVQGNTIGMWGFWVHLQITKGESMPAVFPGMRSKTYWKQLAGWLDGVPMKDLLPGFLWES